MKKSVLLAAAAVSLAFSAGANATITMYTTVAAYTAAVNSSGIDTFNNLTPGAALTASLNRTAGAYAYTVSDSATVLYGAGANPDVWLSNDTNAATITFSGFSPTVSAAGGFFFGSDIGGAFVAAPLGITVSATDANGTVSQVQISPTQTSFLGFVSTNAITSLTVKATVPSSSYWATINNFTLGQANAAPAVPEPATWAMMIGGLGLVGASLRRRKAEVRFA